MTDCRLNSALCGRSLLSRTFMMMRTILDGSTNESCNGNPPPATHVSSSSKGRSRFSAASSVTISTVVVGPDASSALRSGVFWSLQQTIAHENGPQNHGQRGPSFLVCHFHHGRPLCCFSPGHFEGSPWTRLVRVLFTFACLPASTFSRRTIRSE